MNTHRIVAIPYWRATGLMAVCGPSIVECDDTPSADYLGEAVNLAISEAAATSVEVHLAEIEVRVHFEKIES